MTLGRGRLRHRRRIVALLLLGALGGAVTACGGSGGGQDSGPTPLTPQQANRLSQVLYRNHEAGGAVFSLTARDDLSGATITLEGVIDWERLQGRALVVGFADSHGPVTEVAWTSEAVAERRPDRLDVLAARGELPDTFFLRPAAPAAGGLDRLLAIVTALATTQPDNAQLVLQNPGAAFLRRDSLRGTEVEVLRYSDRSVHWVDPVSGVLLRLEATDSFGGSPVVVDLLALGPQQVVLPEVSVLPLP